MIKFYSERLTKTRGIRNYDRETPVGKDGTNVGKLINFWVYFRGTQPILQTDDGGEIQFSSGMNNAFQGDGQS